MDELRALAADLRGQRHQPRRRLHLQPHQQRARVGPEGRRRRSAATRTSTDLPRPDDAGRLRADVREIFPDDHPGSFVQLPDGRWIWATFHPFQWDLNYANPAVFRAMAGEMLFLANQGVEILRMDAVAFIWKRLGTPCESLPEAHLLLRAFNAVLPDGGAVAAVQVRGDRAPRRGDRSTSIPRSASSPTTRCRWRSSGKRWPRATSRLLQQALERRHASARGNGVGQLRAQPRRHRLDVRRRGRRRARHQRLRPPAVPQRLLRQPVPGQLRPRRAVPGQPADRRLPHLRHDGVARGLEAGDRPGRRPHPAGARDRAVAPAASRCCTSATRSRSSTTTPTPTTATAPTAAGCTARTIPPHGTPGAMTPPPRRARCSPGSGT